MKRFRAAWAVWLALGLVAAPRVIAAPDEPLEVRAFEVRYRPLGDAAELIGAVLSAQGTVTLKPRLGTLVVEDRAAVLLKVEGLLRGWDLPPRSVEVTLSLFLGRREGGPAGEGAPRGSALTRDVRGMLDVLGDFTQWTSYEPLGSRSVTGVEGEPVVAAVAGDYRVSFTVHSVHEGPGRTRVKFDRFALQREVPTGDGGRRVDDLYTASMVVEADRLTLLVAASAPDSQRALFLALQVRPR